MSILVVGSANMDLVLRTVKFPEPGETVLGRDFSTHPGGKGANQAVAIGRLGGEVYFVGSVGNDAFGSALLESLRLCGVNTDAVGRSPLPTGCAMIMVNDQAQNMIAVAPGANEGIRLEVVREVGSRHTGIVLVQLEVPLAIVEEASRLGRVIVNPAPACTLPSAVLENLFAITPNEAETAALTGISPVDEASCQMAGDFLHDSGVKNVVMTLGERGCWYSGPEGAFHVPGFIVESVDTTAAGDAFNGALALALDEGHTWKEALRFANAVGALSTTRHGAQESMPTRQEATALVELSTH
ncbi:MAG TPA: ribokinase [Fimbriimonadaceae bacterium]|nr:ribokinase [Fimbriimonadaceae bacterium]